MWVLPYYLNLPTPKEHTLLFISQEIAQVSQDCPTVYTVCPHFSGILSKAFKSYQCSVATTFTAD